MQFRANSKDNLDARCNIFNLGRRVWSSSLPSLSLEGARREGGGVYWKMLTTNGFINFIPRFEVKRYLKKWNIGDKGPCNEKQQFYFNCKVQQTRLFKLGGEKGCDQNNRHSVSPPSRSELLSWKCSLTIKSHSLSSVVALGGSHCCFALF